MKVRSIAASALTCTLLAIASGCSGPNATQALPGVFAPQSVGPFAVKTQKVSFVFDASAKKKGRAAHFLSGATKSIRLTVVHGKTKIATGTMNLTPTSKNCSVTLQSAVCTIAFGVKPGKGYVATITAYDGAKGGGHALSTGQSVAFSVVAGKTATVPLTLDGVPTAIVTQQVDNATILALALDADGNIIVGPGAPVFKATTTGPAVATITQPTASSPNTIRFALAAPPPAPPATETIGVTAIYPANSGRPCSQSGAVCSRSNIATAKYTKTQVYFASDYSNDVINGYTIPITTMGKAPTYSIPASSAWATTSDANGNVFTTSYSDGTLFKVSPPYTGTPVTDAGVGQESYAIAVSPSGIVANAGYSNNTVDLFTSPFTAPPTSVTAGVSSPYGVAFDASNNLYVANYGASTLTVYAAGAYSVVKYTVTLGSGAYSAWAIGSRLYVGESGQVEIFTLPITSSAATPVVTISNGVDGAYALNLDAAGNLWVGNESAATITKYPAPLHNGEAPTVTLSNGLSEPSGGLAFDESGNLYVVDENKEYVAMFKPPFTNASTPAGTSATMSDAFFGTLAVQSHGIFTLSVP